MQLVHIWEVVSDNRLREIPSGPIDLERRLEDWLASHIWVLDPNLLVIGKQVPTAFGSRIDLLCLDSAGHVVVIELKRGRTPREVTSQALDYASWVQNLSTERITAIADDYLGPAHTLPSAFRERFDIALPDDLNRGHRSLIVGESIDADTERIVRYLSDMDVPINASTVHHFRDSAGNSLLARVDLIDPEAVEDKLPPTPKRPTVNGLQTVADDNGIGPIYARLRDGVRGILSAQPYTGRVWYRLRRDDGGVRTVLIAWAAPPPGSAGLFFRLHADRLMSRLGTDFETVRAWLPKNACEADLSDWVGSSEDERNKARGLEGSFQTADEVDKFVGALRNAIAQPPVP